MAETVRVLTARERERLYYDTRSLCPECLALVRGKVLARGGRVLLTRTCPEHGAFEGLVCSDVGWYERLPLFDVAGVPPKGPRTPSKRGCPEDCGLCSRHQQIAGAVAI